MMTIKISNTFRHLVETNRYLTQNSNAKLFLLKPWENISLPLSSTRIQDFASLGKIIVENMFSSVQIDLNVYFCTIIDIESIIFILYEAVLSAMPRCLASAYAM